MEPAGTEGRPRNTVNPPCCPSDTSITRLPKTKRFCLFAGRKTGQDAADSPFHFGDVAFLSQRGNVSPTQSVEIKVGNVEL